MPHGPVVPTGTGVGPRGIRVVHQFLGVVRWVLGWSTPHSGWYPGASRGVGHANVLIRVKQPLCGCAVVGKPLARPRFVPSA